MQQRIERRRRRVLGHGHSRAHLLALGIALSLSGACSKDEDKPGGAAGDTPGAEGPAKVEMVYRAIPGTPLKIKVPTDWSFDKVDPGPEPLSPKDLATKGSDAGVATEPENTKKTKSAAASPLALHSRTMLSARAPESKVGRKLAAWLMVLHDPFLPLGTTSTAYLDAERASNQEALPALTHVEAERSRRQGRPAYYVRDEWTAPLTKEESITFSQETLLLLDAAGEYLHGYSVTITLPKKDRPELEGVLRQIVESVRFQKKK